MKYIPEIRFMGFADAWEQRKLSDITTKIGSGKTPLGGKEAYVEEGVCLIRSQNVYDDMVDLSDVVYIDEETDNSMANSRVLTGDILLNITGASIGRSAVYTESKSANVNQHVCIIRPVKGYEAKYIQLNIASINGQKQIDASQAGGGREGLNFQQIGKMEFMFPNIDEQMKIGTYFESLDNLITLHQRECDETKELKKYMLQKLFPQKGQLVPEIRFKGFTDAWEQRKFDELYKKVSRKNDMTYGTNDIISVANMYYKPDAVVKNEEYLKTYNTFELGDIAFEGNKSKNYAHGRFVENTIGNGIVSHVFDVFSPITEYDLSFWKHYINCESVMGPILTRVTKASTMMTNLVAKDFLKEKIRVPSLEEQQRIGAYLDSIENLISLYQRKCDEIKEMKKYMLQNMFP